MIKRQLPMIALALAAGILVMAGSAMAQTKITKPGGGFPYKITKSGSYFLAENLAVTGKKGTAIVVKADNVTINLNGFTISGLGTGSTGTGIDASAATGVLILNGTITGYGTGIALSSNSTIQNVQILSDAADGVNVAGSSCVVSNSLISGNGGIGLDFADATSGYLNNVLTNNTNVQSGFNMGGNVCSGSAC
jgi:hypothetical protein